ncbi:mannosyltransferase putative-domain-containing protein [Absidia repens]|uniref:Mannosyltransferase putative-domain-containing protein n=1 Tax=Absidia repens TaxID=90262 RepID=A0A1X2I624_9FUNG|nr:mannosyltransferase putative-domain-containing protein [Absidia repens]
MKKPVPTSKIFKGSGIVLVAGNGDTFTRALTTIKLLRNYGCSLPIDVWHLNDEQPTVEMAKELNDLQAQPRDLSDKNLIRPIDERRGASKQFQIKVAAIINSAFENVLYLDSDNIPTTDPSFLFDHPAYLKTGALFWPDFWKTHGENSIFDILGVDCTDEWEQESGQMVINKIKSWHPLQLAWYMNDHHGEPLLSILNGDKDTFRFAWKALKVPYYMNPNYLGMGGTLIDDKFCGHTMIQYPPPFSSERPWEWIKRYPKGTKTTWLLPEFYISGFSRACMDFSSNQGELRTELEPFDSVVSGLQQLYFDFGGIGGETRG